MPTTSFLHGVETREVEVGGETVTVVVSSVGAIFGVAPTGPTNVLTLCTTPQDDAQFGSSLPGFNIPKTLEIVRAAANSCPILVVNLFNPSTNTAQVSLESQTVTGGKLQLAYAPIGSVSIFQSDGTTVASIVLGTDYTLDAFGNFQVISSTIADATTYKFTYKRFDPSTVTATQLNGGVDENNNRTGAALFDLAYNQFGFKPKIFVSPGYSSLSAVASNMAAMALKFRAVYCLDAPYGTTPNGAIAGRGVGADLVFNTADDRAILLYPYLKTYDDYSQADEDYPYSAFMLGAIIANDLANGYWFSPSNKQMLNVTGSERTIEWSLNDQNCEANLLNAAGITTIAEGYGTGIRTWGNRNASFPTTTSVKNFIAIRRADDMVIETMEQATLPYVDQPMTQALIDTIREKGNSLFRTLIQRGAALPGSRATYNSSENSPTDLANGQITFDRTWMVGPPAERITYNDIMDVSLLTFK